MRFRPLLTALAGALALAGCVGESSRSVAPRLPAPGDIRLTLTETLPGRTLLVDARTERQYSCSNFHLDGRLTRVNEGFRIAFTGVREPNICLTSTGPARARFDLGHWPNGVVSLDVTGPAGGTNGWIEVSDDAYLVVARPGPIAVEHRVLRRIPAGHVWGYFGYARPEIEAEARAVLEDVRRLGAETRRLPSGHYAVALQRSNYADAFDVNVVGGIEYEGSRGYYHLLPFSLGFHGDPAALRERVARVGREAGDRLHWVVMTSEGHAFLSWVLGRP